MSIKVNDIILVGYRDYEKVEISAESESNSVTLPQNMPHKLKLQRNRKVFMYVLDIYGKEQKRSRACCISLSVTPNMKNIDS